MKILATHPGRFGDLFWALSTVRALAATFHTPVDLLLSPSYSPASLQELLVAQPYIGQLLVGEWPILETAPITPRIPPQVPVGYDRIIHLGYEGWPNRSLPWEICRLAEQQGPLKDFDLHTPWIVSPLPLTCDVVVGFSDEYFELKYGVEHLLWRHLIPNDATRGRVANVLRVINVSGGPRWEHEGLATVSPWSTAASWIAGAKVFVGCCSALHVLACAIGTPVILIEPQPARHHDVFYPYGKQGPQVELLLGGDGLPTFDSRHLIDAVDARLALQAATT